MIVLGADTHKRSHTIAAVAATTGELLGEQTVPVGARGLRGAAGLGARPRTASGSGRWRTAGTSRARFERFLIARGERVVRVPTRLMAGARRARRERGKSDSIDAIAVARAALREGLDALPAAQLAGPELDLRLLVDHRERLVRQRVALNNTLQWHLHDLWPELELPGGALFSRKWATADRAGAWRAPSRRCASGSRATSCAACASSRRRSTRSKREIAELVAQVAPQLLAEPGFGPLTAAKLVGEIAGADRFATDAKLARAAGVAPIPVSSGKTNRHRLDRGGNRQINAAIHRIAVTRARCHPETQDYIARKTRRRQDQPRSHPLPQTPPRPPHLAPPPAAPPRPGTPPTPSTS